MTDALLAKLTAQVRGAFPGLEFSHAALNQKGEDHHVLMLDQRYAFRFPRHSNHPTGLKFELAVLAALKGQCPLPMPDYRYVSPAGDFAGYEMIDGVELTPPRFAALERRAQERVLAQVAEFLSAMHGLALDDVIARLGAEPDPWPHAGTPVDAAADGRARRLGPIARDIPDLAALVDDFYTRLALRPAAPVRLTHSDVTADHLMLAPSRDRLAGVIDFGDAELGDPAYDFGYLWSYGDWAPAFVFERYALRDGDPGLLERSRWNYVRYRISRLGEALENRWAEVASEIANSLPALLAAL